MKYFARFIIFCLIFCAAGTERLVAECGGNSLSFITESKDANLPTDTLIFLHVHSFFYASDKNIDWERLIKGEHYLSRGDRIIRLSPVEGLTTELFLTDRMIVLKPEEKLEANIKYKLRVSLFHLGGYAVRAIDSPDRKVADLINDDYEFTTGLSPAEKPAEKVSGLYSYLYEYHRYGCGPSNHHLFKAKSGLVSPLYMCRIRKTGAKDYNSVIVKNNLLEQTIYIGHGMCGGDYAFEKGSKYELAVAPMNFAGEIGEFSEPLEFTAGEAEIVDSDDVTGGIGK